MLTTFLGLLAISSGLALPPLIAEEFASRQPPRITVDQGVILAGHTLQAETLVLGYRRDGEKNFIEFDREEADILMSSAGILYKYEGPYRVQALDKFLMPLGDGVKVPGRGGEMLTRSLVWFGDQLISPNEKTVLPRHKIVVSPHIITPRTPDSIFHGIPLTVGANDYQGMFAFWEGGAWHYYNAPAPYYHAIAHETTGNGYLKVVLLAKEPKYEPLWVGTQALYHGYGPPKGELGALWKDGKWFISNPPSMKKPGFKNAVYTALERFGKEELGVWRFWNDNLDHYFDTTEHVWFDGTEWMSLQKAAGLSKSLSNYELLDSRGDLMVFYDKNAVSKRSLTTEHLILRRRIK